jgi:NADH-quinone oxidoreductase subunit G
MPMATRALVAPSEMVDALAAVAAALVTRTGKALSEALAAKAPTKISDDAHAIAQSLADGEKTAVWLGNLAEQHPRAAELHLWAQEIARLSGASFGFIGEAANSVGGYLANAVPGGDGLNAREMIESPRHAYVLFGAEPDLDFANGAAAVDTMSRAKLVVAISAFDSPALRQVAHVLLPLSPFTETPGTFVNCIGDAQSFEASTYSLGESRPGWKILRVLGNLLELPGFEQNDFETVRDEALAGGGSDGFRARLDNAIGDVPAATLPEPRAGTFQRVADVPVYFADPLVRRASSLQKTADAAPPVVRMPLATMAALGVQPSDKVRVTGRTGGTVELLVEADENLAPGCVRVAAAHVSTVPLGSLHGELSVERL